MDNQGELLTDTTRGNKYMRVMKCMTTQFKKHTNKYRTIMYYYNVLPICKIPFYVRCKFDGLLLLALLRPQSSLQII